MAKKKVNPSEQLMERLYADLETKTPGNKDFSEVVGNIITLRRLEEENLERKTKKDLDILRLKIEQNKMDLELKKFELEVAKFDHQKENDKLLREDSLEKISEDRRHDNKKQVLTTVGQVLMPIITGLTTLAAVKSANKSADRRTYEILKYEETGSISSTAGKQTLSNTLKPIKW